MKLSAEEAKLEVGKSDRVNVRLNVNGNKYSKDVNLFINSRVGLDKSQCRE